MNSSFEASDSLYRLVLSIQENTEFDHPVEQFRLLETHISYILLTGPYAYKFKKPVDLGFLDFRTLEQRKFYCEEELRLNKRLAPELYIGVVSFTGVPDRPVLNGNGPVLEYAVRMEQFAESEQALFLLRDGKLTNEHIEQLARQLAQFHECVAVAKPGSEYGEPHLVLQDAMDNFTALQPMLAGDAEYSKRLDELAAWTNRTYKETQQRFTERKQNGFIRECHGDLHLGNIVRHRNEMLIFDCIEFSPSLHWIDVMNDLAFLIMDLHEHDQPAMAQRLLNEYLQKTGDYEGLYVLRFYLVYRALVRSKVAGIRLRQSHTERQDIERETGNEHRYLDLARTFIRPADPALIITHGLSGSGKSTVSRDLADKINAIWIRSDVERKRLHDLQDLEQSHSGLRSGIYSAESTVNTYQRLAAVCRTLLAAGCSVIVDATFLQHQVRRSFYSIAREYGLPIIILDFQADEATLKSRLQQRGRQGREVSEADLEVLADQIGRQDPLDDLETQFSINIDTTSLLQMDDLKQSISMRKKQKIDAGYVDLGTA